jgi:AcrR family transcriptional regulator
VQDGFAATTIVGIARAAGVSPETIYKSFGSKTALLEVVVRAAIRGDANRTPLRERAVIEEIRQAASARTKLTLYGRLLETVQPRLAPLHRVMREAAAAHPEISDALHRLNADRLDGMTELAQELAAGGWLAPGVGTERARDVLWTLNSPEVYELLVSARGWTGAQYREWVVETLIDTLL